MADKLEIVINLFSLASKQIDPETMPEARAALAETAKQLIEKAKATIEQILVSLEKDIADGKIVDPKIIKQVAEFRDKYNAL